MDNEQVYRDPLARISDLVKDTFGDIFNAYFEGDPIQLPDAAMPCVIFEKLAGTVSVKGAPTGHDNISEKIRIRLVLNKTDDFNPEQLDYDLTERKLRKLVEARDPATGWFLPNTLMFVLRTNISLGSTVLDQDIDVQYDLQPRPEKLVTSEAIITIVVRDIVQVPNRL
jgi:hypothetical protein